MFHVRELRINEDFQNRQGGYHCVLVDHPLLEGLEIRFQHHSPDRVRVVLLAGPPVSWGVEILQVALGDVVEDGSGLDALVGKEGGALGEDLGAELGVWREEVGVEVGENGGEDGEGGMIVEGLEGVGTEGEGGVAFSWGGLFWGELFGSGGEV